MLSLSQVMEEITAYSVSPADAFSGIPTMGDPYSVFEVGPDVWEETLGSYSVSKRKDL